MFLRDITAIFNDLSDVEGSLKHSMLSPHKLLSLKDGGSLFMEQTNELKVCSLCEWEITSLKELRQVQCCENKEGEDIAFHENCINIWMKSKEKCPVCCCRNA